MSITLNKFLKSEGYSSVKLIFSETKHYLIEAKINGTNGRFILDTGASNSCICTSLENKFKIISEESKEKASSANSEMTNTKISESNALQIGKWEDKINLITFDMNHINNALSEKQIDPIDGIIGADILKKSKAIIDYHGDKIYLKMNKFEKIQLLK
ncbi:retroviral-like aspartic protease family protein [Flavobacteriaceae bacterium]|nr:retroviral-like aspartic protease family protein [Flavobacteriaceae bacterium]MDC1459501.1 retroviral-like aspartic protease family protein [Flavobacteriaceae bacterium]MDC3221095.1 retroviral-like aspartic protease family protein [Flavobacteriaceae bacterium]